MLVQINKYNCLLTALHLLHFTFVPIVANQKKKNLKTFWNKSKSCFGISEERGKQILNTKGKIKFVKHTKTVNKIQNRSTRTSHHWKLHFYKKQINKQAVVSMTKLHPKERMRIVQNLCESSQARLLKQTELVRSFALRLWMPCPCNHSFRRSVQEIEFGK